MLSMTGFGRGEYKEKNIELAVEIKTVNNRFFDANIRAPRIFSVLEDAVRNKLRESITRGHLEVYVSLSDKREKKKEIIIDMGVAASYVEACKKIALSFPEAENDVTVNSILRFPDVMKSDDIQSIDDELEEALLTAVSQATQKLNEMREKEGEKLKKDILSRTETIECELKKIKERAPMLEGEYKEKIFARVKEYLSGVNVDEARLLTEVCVFADKVNIDEEMTRLSSHISQLREISKEKIVGRKLDFLIQEFNREANTICSKSNDIQITSSALLIKNEIEKIREQVQNLE